MVCEVIRWQTPLAHMRRTATRDTELGGKRIKKGDKVVMWYVSANRDESGHPPGERVPDRPRERPPAPVVRLGRALLRRQPPGRDAAPHPLGGDPRAFPRGRGRRPAGPRSVQLREGLREAPGSRPPLVGAGRGARASISAPAAHHATGAVAGGLAPFEGDLARLDGVQVAVDGLARGADRRRGDRRSSRACADAAHPGR